MPCYRQSERINILAETRQRLLQAAAQQFAAKGYAAANVNEISLAAGFSKGTLYNYFASKQVLMDAPLTQVAQAHAAFVAEQVQPEADAVRRLQRFFEASFAFIADHPAEARL